VVGGLISPECGEIFFSKIFFRIFTGVFLENRQNGNIYGSNEIAIFLNIVQAWIYKGIE